MKPYLRFFLAGACLMVAYVLAARLGFAIQAVTGNITEVWIPTGISLSALLLLGESLWPAVYIGALAANKLMGASWGVSAAIALGNTLEAWVGARALRHYAQLDFSLSRVRDVSNLALMAAIGSTCLSALIGSVTLCLGHVVPWTHFATNARLWWLGDMASDILVAPVLLIWSTRPYRRWPSERGLEAACMIAAVILVNLLIFTPATRFFMPSAGKAYFLFPTLVWAALRFGPSVVSLAILVTSVLSINGVMHGWGPFLGKDMTDGLVDLQVFMVVNALTALVLAAVASERAQAEEAVRESETRFRKAADDAPMMLWMADANLKCNYVNHQWLSFTGRTFAEEMGRHMTDDIHPEDVSRCLDAYAEALSERKPFHIEYRLRRFDGDYHWVESHGDVRFLSNRKFQGYIATCIDVHDRKMGEQELEKKVERRTSQLEMLNRELEAFSYSISHDLRAPLRAIDGFSRELVENPNIQLDFRARSDLRRVRSATQRMTQLIDDLLSFSRLSRSQIKREKVDLSVMARQIIDELRAISPERQVDFKLTPHATAGGDAHLLRIVMDNLIGNAWKFTTKTANPEIEFGVRQESERRAFFIRDNGAGFNMDYADKLFGVFQRLHPEKEFPGTGIGLATVQRIIHRHGGTIWAEAREGQGATFFFTLP